MSQYKSKPIVLCFSGLDPSGGAGIQADIEAISAQQAHASVIATALTVQDTHNIHGVEPVDGELITRQADAIFNDFNISVIKIGLLNDIKTTTAIHHILKKHSHIPVVFDPILAAGGGTELASKELIDAFIELIIPLCFIITPNILEAQKLSREKNIDRAAEKLFSHGAKNILITGTHADTQHVSHKLFYNESFTKTYDYSRLKNEYHGSGCTLTASIAALLGHQQKTEIAVHNALDYCYETLVHASKLGQGQYIPQRNL